MIFAQSYPGMTELDGTRPQPTHRFFTALTAALLLTGVSTAAFAQAQTPTTYYSGVAVLGEPVIVDLSALEALGPPPNMQMILRQPPVVPGAGSPVTNRQTAQSSSGAYPTAPVPQQTASAPASGLELDAQSLVGATPSASGSSAAASSAATAPASAPSAAASSAAALAPQRPSTNVPEAPTVAAVPKPVAATPKPVAATPKPVAATPEPVAAKPEPVAAPVPQPVSQPAPEPAPEPVAATPPAPAPAPEPVAVPVPAPAPEPIKVAEAPKRPTAADPVIEAKKQAEAAKEAEAEGTEPPKVASLPTPSQGGADGVVTESDGTLTVAFDAKASELPSGATAALDRLVARMEADPALRIQLVGYASNDGESASESRRLSLFRALSVRTYLIKKGVRSIRMDVRALGAKIESGAPNRVDIVSPIAS